MTNADKIRNMTDEEMASFLDACLGNSYCCCCRLEDFCMKIKEAHDEYLDCEAVKLLWLEQEA